MRLDGPKTSAASLTVCSSCFDAPRSVTRLTERATVQQPALDDARVLGRVAEHGASSAVRASRRPAARLVRAAAVLIRVGARQERGHELGMSVTQRTKADVDRLLRGMLRGGVAAVIDLEVRLVLQGDDQILFEALRHASTGSSSSSSARTSFGAAAIAMDRRHQHAGSQRLGVIGTEPWTCLP